MATNAPRGWLAIWLGYYLRQTADYAAARPYYERALAINETVLGPQHPDTALSLNNLAWLCHAEGDNAAAVTLMRRALAIREAVLVVEHPLTRGSRASLATFEARGDDAPA